ncbi:ubiquitin carboxyl-terminal hydrolase 2-like protein [Tanacetum coccineum]
MGKKVKKGTTRKTVPTKAVSQKIIPTAVVDSVSAVREERVCPHLDKGVNVEKVSLKMALSESHKCEDCREGAIDKRAGKGKHGKKKGGGSASESKSIWVCLECGQFTCGGIGFPTVPQSHATRHPLAVKLANPNLRWCFPCNTLLPAKSLDENGEQIDGEQKDVLAEVCKVLKAQRPSNNSLDVESVYFGSGSVLSESTSANKNSLSSSDTGGGHKVKGLLNLGNTCFLNSALQNLLAIDRLRDHYLKMETGGPLSVSLKKLFVEANPLASGKHVVNPRPLFNSICAIASQFKGYQQQDSHEVLRFLLDGLSSEETSIQKCDPKNSPTFVDVLFGGQISSSVSCLECGHTSVVYEPYLDLSLPLPTKKVPSKKVPPVPSKKLKPPPKRRGRIATKINKTSETTAAANAPVVPTTSDPSHAENNVIEKMSEMTIREPDVSSDNMALVVYVEPSTVLNSNGNENSTVDSSDDFSWLDYVNPAAVPSDQNADASVGDYMATDEAILQQVIEASKIESNGMKEAPPSTDDSVLQEVIEASKTDFNGLTETPPFTDVSWLDYAKPSSSSWLDNAEPSSSSNDHNMASNAENGTGVLQEEEPKLIQQSEVILLPYEELTSTSNGDGVVSYSAGCEKEETSDIEGFGGLFDEPEEVVYGPAVGPVSNGVVESGWESDCDEVDNTDSQVSVDKCLAYFTASELLTKTEHAWHCEQCSKALIEQKNKLQECVPNGAKNGNSNISSDSVTDYPVSNGSHNDESDCGQITSEVEEKNSLVNGEDSCSVQDTDSCQANGSSDNSKDEKVERRVSKRLATKNGSNPVEKNGVDKSGVDSSKVKVIRDASKRILINKVPPILTIHLKRLSQDARGRLSKLNGHVDFKEVMDLKPYMDPSCCKDRDTYKYRLTGVVEHLGTMRGGHYVAYVRGPAAKGNNDCVWYHASDAHVKQVSFEEVLRCEAYILFYEEM